MPDGLRNGKLTTVGDSMNWLGRRLVDGSLRRRSTVRTVAAWVLAVIGPVLFALALLPFRSSVGLTSVLFCTLLVVVVVATMGGVLPAILAAGVGFLVGDFFFTPPYDTLSIHLATNRVSVIVFAIVGVVVGALVAILIAQLAQLANEQAALRRVATLAARGAPPEEVFAAVTEEIGQLLPVEYAGLSRYEPDGSSATIVAGSGSRGDRVPVGRRWILGGNNVTTLVFETGRPARIDSYADASGALSVAGREERVGSGAGAPVIVEGRVWGVMAVYSAQEQSLPADTEARLANFTELLATAIANAESRAELSRLAEEQAALRRVATLVARGAPPEEVFAAVTEEVGQLLPVDSTAMGCYEPDGTLVFVASGGRAANIVPVGSRWSTDGKNVGAAVFETGRPVRIDDYADASGRAGVNARDNGIRSSVGSPIVVEGRMWGGVWAAPSE
jgi:GAF domain-containing protein